MKFRMLFVAAALLALCTGMSFGQGASVLFFELDQTLTGHCDGSDCLHDGSAMIEIKQDVNNNGNADYATDPLAIVGSNAGEWNFNTLPINGEANLGECGKFYADLAWTSVGALPANNRFYLYLNTGTAVWVTAVFSVVVGPFDHEAAWLPCQPVVPSCTPSNLNGTFSGPGQVCLGFCPDALDARWLVECDPRSAGPIVNVTPGCPDCGNPNCNPVATTFNVVPVGPGLWEINVHAAGEGCACLHFGGCQPFCVPDPFLGLTGDRDHVCPTWPGASGCVHVCPGSTTLVTVCGLGGPLNPVNTPLATVSGCATLGAWTYNTATGCFEAVLVGECDGTACVCVEGFLAANVTSFTAVPMSNSVRMDFATASETNVDRFEITRAIKGHADAATVGRIEAENSATGHSYSWTDNNAVNGTSYVYNLVVVNTDGSSENAGTVEATPSLTNAVITEYALAQNFPNPFNPSTQIVFDVVTENYTTLKVFNANGQEVATLFNGIADAGRHIVNFDAANLTSGLYFYTVKIGNEFTATKKMMLVK